MITATDVALAEYIVDQSSMVEIIFAELRDDGPGVKPSAQNLRLLFVGMFLSIHHRGSGTITDIFDLITRQLDTATQIRLGVRRELDLGLQLNIENLYYFTKTINRRLNWGRSVAPALGKAEVQRRRRAILSVCDNVMDVFQLGWTSDTFALDATGLWAWGKGKKRPRRLTKKQKRTKKELAALEEEAAADDAILLSSGMGFEILDPTSNPEVVPPEILAALEELNQDATTPEEVSHDPDAGWGYKTAKVDGVEIFYGLHEHTLVQTPGKHQKPDDEPRLIVRFEITPANEGVVEVSLALLDRTKRRVKYLLVDKLYHYQKVENWLKELLKRGIFQVHDLRKDEQGFTEVDGMRFAAGQAHCPRTPDVHGVIVRPAPNAPKEEQEAFGAAIEKRYPYALRIVNQPDENGVARYQCPAIEGKVGCPLREGTMQAALEAGLPRIQNPPNEERDGEPLPRCCTQQSVEVTLPEQIFKLAQRLRYGTKIWNKLFRQRTYVEGSYGNRKNNSTENLRRGLHRLTGLANGHLVMAMVNASYDLRILRNWHDRQMEINGHSCRLCIDGLHPLLATIVEPAAVLHLDANEHLHYAMWKSQSIA